MPVSLNNFAPMYARMVDTAAHLLDRGLAYAAENGVSEQELLGWRLADDMNPLSFQLAIVVNFSKGWIARAAGVEAPEIVIGADMDVAAFKAAFADARVFLDSLATQLSGRDDVAITYKLMDNLEPTQSAGQWITGFATTNIYFHVSMAYAILRMRGVPLGKLDMFPKGL